MWLLRNLADKFCCPMAGRCWAKAGSSAICKVFWSPPPVRVLRGKMAVLSGIRKVPRRSRKKTLCQLNSVRPPYLTHRRALVGRWYARMVQLLLNGVPEQDRSRRLWMALTLLHLRREPRVRIVWPSSRTARGVAKSVVRTQSHRSRRHSGA